MAGYYNPLWEEYHIFALYTGSGDLKVNNEILSQKAKSYTDYTLDPNRDKVGTSTRKSVDILGASIDKITLQKQTKLIDYEGELFINQAVEYMKYAEIGAGLELLLDKLSLLEQAGKISYIMEEKQKVEEELVEIDREILNLMKLYDGLMTSKKGIELDKNGALKTTNSFIKKICYSEITMDSVAINNESIFQAQKDKYINPSSSFFNNINSSFLSIENTYRYISGLNGDITALEKLITECKAELKILNSKDEKTKKDKEDIKKLNKYIDEYSDDLKNLQKQIKNQEELIKKDKANIISLTGQVNKLINEILPLYDDGIASINKIIDKSKLAAPLIEEYETLLEGSKDELSEEVYEGLEEELKQIKKYTVSDTSGYDFTGMLRIHEDNKQVLVYTILLLKNAKEALDGEDITVAANSYRQAEEYLKKYQIQGLALDYSTLVYDRNNQKEALDKVNETIASGLSSLVINPDDISEAVLSSIDKLPSFIHALTDESTDYSQPVASFFSNAKAGDKNTAGSLFSGFKEETDIKGVLSDGVNRLAEMLLFREYIDEHFTSYQAKELDKAEKPGAIQYEKEYLIIGKYSDAANLNAIIARIFLIRMVFAFISVLSNSSVRNEAKLIAAGIVGFTGLSILVYITQMLIMLIWSFAEALLDTTAIMMGKDVPIIKKKVDMTFPEIFMLTREQLSKKAAGLKDTKELSLNYNNYLKVFLMMTSKEKLAYRSMDIIQENLKLRYKDDGFNISNCLYGLEMSAQYEIMSKFTSFTFLQKYYDSNKDVYQYSMLAANSY